MPRPRGWLALLMVTGPQATCGAGSSAFGGGQAGGVTPCGEGPGQPQSANLSPFPPISSIASYGPASSYPPASEVVLTHLRPVS